MQGAAKSKKEQVGMALPAGQPSRGWGAGLPGDQTVLNEFVRVAHQFQNPHCWCRGCASR